LGPQEVLTAIALFLQDLKKMEMFMANTALQVPVLNRNKVDLVN
jgi:hypothetical protein